VEIKKRTFARVGLVGNPSDGFYGKTLSSCINNFHAEVTLTESEDLEIVPHTVHDPVKFVSLAQLAETSHRFGYYGGIRLVYATCKGFYEYCKGNNIVLAERNCSIKYDTTIPRQVGLGGSSAIIVSLWKALMDFYGVETEQIPLDIQPNLIRGIETEELGIAAGLQDRVVQTYGGTVYMDFDKAVMQRLGHGVYERVYYDIFPNLFLAYVENPGKDSGKMHNQIRFRFNEGDTKVIEAMCNFQSYALEAKHVLLKGDLDRFAQLMCLNFQQRLRLYGGEALGEDSLQMISIASELGSPAKFPGSGGAVVGVYSSGEQFRNLELAYAEAGFKFANVRIDIV